MRVSIFLCLLFWLAPAYGLTIDTKLPDAAQEETARALFTEIRCVVCQSESIADSPADVASDMRRLIRERIAAGDTVPQIKSYLVSRYGDRVLMRPPLKAQTWVLWFAPLLILMFAACMTLRYFRRKPA